MSEKPLSDDMWPDADINAAHIAFTTTLHRLRNFLVFNKAITLKGHRVSIDRHNCSVDMFVLQELLSQTLWHCQYHIVWVPKYRYKILSGKVGTLVENCIRAFSQQQGGEVIELNVQIDHVHYS